MLLTKKQYHHQHEVFNKVSGLIRTLQETAKEEFEKSDKSLYARALMIGRSSALEDSYNLLRREADSAYQKEPVAADTLLDSSLKHLEDHLKAVKFLTENIDATTKESLNNVIAVMDAIIKNALIIVRQTEQPA